MFYKIVQLQMDIEKYNVTKNTKIHSSALKLYRQRVLRTLKDLGALLSNIKVN